MSSLLTGTCICLLFSREEARKMGELLHKWCYDALILEDPNEISNAIPHNVKRWVRRCRRTGRVVAPYPIVNG